MSPLRSQKMLWNCFFLFFPARMVKKYDPVNSCKLQPARSILLYYIWNAVSLKSPPVKGVSNPPPQTSHSSLCLPQGCMWSCLLKGSPTHWIPLSFSQDGPSYKLDWFQPLRLNGASFMIVRYLECIFVFPCSEKEESLSFVSIFLGFLSTPPWASSH